MKGKNLTNYKGFISVLGRTNTHMHTHIADKSNFKKTSCAPAKGWYIPGLKTISVLNFTGTYIATYLIL